MINYLEYIGNILLRTFPNSIRNVVQSSNEIYINVVAEDLLKICYFLKKNTFMQFQQLMDIWAVDYLGRQNRYEVLYNFLSIRYNIRVIIKVRLAEDAGINSLCSLYNSANWLEREVWDMYGIFFLIIPI